MKFKYIIIMLVLLSLKCREKDSRKNCECDFRDKLILVYDYDCVSECLTKKYSDSISLFVGIRFAEFGKFIFPQSGSLESIFNFINSKNLDIKSINAYSKNLTIGKSLNENKSVSKIFICADTINLNIHSLTQFVKLKKVELVFVELKTSDSIEFSTATDSLFIGGNANAIVSCISKKSNIKYIKIQTIQDVNLSNILKLKYIEKIDISKTMNSKKSIKSHKYKDSIRNINRKVKIVL